jgi:uncharacterized protein (DUF169 family)
MEINEFVQAVERANCAVDLQRCIVGVRFLFSHAEFEVADAPIPSARMTYCKMVIRASKGEDMKVDVNNFGCFAAARVLGIVELDDWYVSGHYYGTSGLYRDYPTAKQVTGQMSRCGHKAVGLEIRPLENFTSPPHVVITISNPFNIMRLVQGYAYHFGNCESYKFIGNQAMCAEGTAHPYKSNDLSLSLLCAGARRVGLNTDELAIGIPLSKFVAMVDGLCQTITPVENNTRKTHIKKQFFRTGEPYVPITLNTNYGTAMMKYDMAHFVKKKRVA